MVNQFLEKHDVDVSRSLALLALVGGTYSVLLNFLDLAVKGLHVDLSFIIAIPLGINLWKYRPGSRVAVIILSWLMALAITLMSVFAFLNSEQFTLTIRNEIIKGPSIKQLLIFDTPILLITVFTLLVVHSRKFKDEVFIPRQSATQPVAGGDATR